MMTRVASTVVIAALAWATGAVTPATGVTGTVITDDATPRPVRGARVYVDNAASRTIDAITDDQGAFALPLTAGRYVIRASKDGWPDVAYRANGTAAVGAVTRVVVRGDAPTPITVVLPRGAVISGIVRDASGAPRQNVGVKLQRDESPYEPTRTPAAVAVTDDEGAYRAFGLRAGRYVVRVAETDAASGSARALYYPGVATRAEAAVVTVASGDERSGIDITGDPPPAPDAADAARGGLWSAFTTIDGTDRPLTDAAVDVLSSDCCRQGSDRATLSARAPFFSAPPGAQWALAAPPPASLSAAAWVIERADWNGVDLTSSWFSLIPPIGRPDAPVQIAVTDRVGSVAGTLMSAAQPPALFGVVVLPEDEARWHQPAWRPRLVWPDTDGHWEAAALPAGAWRVAVVASSTPGLLTDAASLRALAAAGAALTITAHAQAALDLRVGAAGGAR